MVAFRKSQHRHIFLLPDSLRHFSLFPPRAISSFLSVAGFDDVSCRHYHLPADLWAYSRGSSRAFDWLSVEIFIVVRFPECSTTCVDLDLTRPSSSSVPPDVHHQHHQDQVEPTGQARPLPGHALLRLPHRTEPGLRVPEPLLRRGGRLHPGLRCGPLPGK